MYTISIYNHKGGVGKTTLTGAISGELVSQKKKVLMVDTDSQANLTNQFLTDRNFTHEITDYLQDYTIGLENCIYPTRYDYLYIAPTRKESEKGKLNTWIYAEAGKLENRDVLNYLVEDAQKLGFDYLIFDMPPSYSELDKKVMMCSDEILPVLEIAQNSMEGLVDFYQLLTKLKGRSEKPVCNKLVFNKVQKSKVVQKALLPAIEKMPSKTYLLPNDESIRKAELKKVAVQELGMKHETQEILEQLVADLAH